MSGLIQLSATPARGTCLRAVIYIRVSTKKQVNKAVNPEGYSLPTQRDACLRKAADLGAEVVDVYIDRGESAKTTDREDFQRMLARLRAQSDVDFVIVYRINRFARDSYDDATLDRELHSLGIELVSAIEHIDRTPAGRLNHRMLAAMAEYESANLAVETMRGMRRKAQDEGGTNYRAPSGYLNTLVEMSDPTSNTVRRVKTVVMDETRAKHMAWMFEAYATGQWTDEDLAQELKARGVRQRPTTKFPDRPYMASAIAKILTSRYYIGETKFEGVWHKGGHPALVSPETFALVQAVRKARHSTGVKVRYGGHFLKSFLHCARCAEPLGIEGVHNRFGTFYRYFNCLGRRQRGNGCVQRFIPTSRVEQAVAEYWKCIEIPDSELLTLRAKALVKVQKEYDQSKVKLVAQRKRSAVLEQERKRLLGAFYGDAISMEVLRDEQTRIDRELSEARSIVTALETGLDEARSNLEHAIAVCGSASKLYANADEQVRYMLNQDLFERIWIKDDTVVGADVTPLYREVLRVAERPMYSRALAGTRYVARALQRLSQLLRFERPFGRLEWETRNPDFWGSRGSDGNTLVTLARARPNQKLIRYVQEQAKRQPPGQQTEAQSSPPSPLSPAA
ncbi:recombinase family protein [Streptomyces olivoreticuli]